MTKHVHASPPNASFNALLRQELCVIFCGSSPSVMCQGRPPANSWGAPRQAVPVRGPARFFFLQGGPFKGGKGGAVPFCRSYVMLSAAVEAPSPSLVTRRLRLLRAPGRAAFLLKRIGRLPPLCSLICFFFWVFLSYVFLGGFSSLICFLVGLFRKGRAGRNIKEGVESNTGRPQRIHHRTQHVEV